MREEHPEQYRLVRAIGTGVDFLGTAVETPRSSGCPSAFVVPGRPSLDALLFLREVLTYCRGQPVVLADCGEWHDWPLDRLDREGKRETWGDRSLIEV